RCRQRRGAEEAVVGQVDDPLDLDLDAGAVQAGLGEVLGERRDGGAVATVERTQRLGRKSVQLDLRDEGRLGQTSLFRTADILPNASTGAYPVKFSTDPREREQRGWQDEQAGEHDDERFRS